jgi:hypothetical protein
LIRHLGMSSPCDLDQQIDHLQRTLGLPGRAAERVIDEVLSYCQETVEQFVRRRHRELQALEEKNDVIFERILGELQKRRFSAPALTPRQIRRLIYG